MDDPSSLALKKTRKPYTLTKQRESWTAEEHDRFITALQLYNRDWKKIEKHVGSKTVVQVNIAAGTAPCRKHHHTSSILVSSYADSKPCTEIFPEGDKVGLC